MQLSKFLIGQLLIIGLIPLVIIMSFFSLTRQHKCWNSGLILFTFMEELLVVVEKINKLEFPRF